MSANVKVAPSILSADFGRLAEEVRAVEAAGADVIHVDVMDGRFVPNLTIGPLVVRAVRAATKLPLDVHLMIVEPERYVDEFARAGADLISVHLEASPHLHRTIQHIKSLGKKASVAVNPHSPLDGLDVVLPDLDMVLLMSVNPGFGGQRFIEAVVPKIAALRATIDAPRPRDGHRGRRRRRARHGGARRGRGRERPRRGLGDLRRAEPRLPRRDPGPARRRGGARRRATA